jgi:lipopolysaccharide biosynthesis glycosyltransferase
MYNVVIGYDRANRIPAYTLADSIMEHSSVPINFIFLHRNTLNMYTRERSVHDSTDFSNSRFLAPFLSEYKGWTLYLDNDMIVKDDIKKLFDYVDDKYSVMCVKHNQIVERDTKFFGAEQYEYRLKNWSSVMLFNNAYCDMLTPEYINTAKGLDLHQFRWLDSEELIGELPLEWNYLVANKNQTDKPPKLIHYTEGGPYFKETKDCEYADDWREVYKRINDVRT